MPRRNHRLVEMRVHRYSCLRRCLRLCSQACSCSLQLVLLAVDVEMRSCALSLRVHLYCCLCRLRFYRACSHSLLLVHLLVLLIDLLMLLVLLIDLLIPFSLGFACDLSDLWFSS
jgi:hypothetical protein